MTKASEKKKLIAIKYESEEIAEKGWKEMQSLEKKKLVDLDESAMIVVDDSGKAKMKHTTELTPGKGATKGGIVGLIVGLIFMYPVAVGLIGAAFGALWAKAKDSGMSEDFMKKVHKEVKPGNAAIFLLVEESAFNSVVDAMKKYKGELFYTSLNSVSEKKLTELTSNSK